MGHFAAFFEGAETFLTPKLKGNFGVKNVEAPPKTPRNAPLYVLPQTKK
jgi:hypothetical protein